MGKNKIRNATDLAKYIINEKLSEGMIAIDATVGNGYDTLQLAKKVGETGKVYGFDIQEDAIKNTAKLLFENNMKDRVLLFQESHEKLLDHIHESIDLGIFNLGYLPKGDHTIVTKPDSTIKAIESILYSMKENGILIVVVYYGHVGGLEEKEAVEAFLMNLDQKQFTVFKMDFINQVNCPPFVLCIEKS